MSKTILAIPSQMPGGMDSGMGMHFGHCDIYTIVELENGQVAGQSTLPPIPHQQGGCMAPVQYLASHGVNAMLAGGMGMRPLQALQAAGIAVYYNANLPTVADCLNAFAAGRLVPFGPGHLCQSGCASER